MSNKIHFCSWCDEEFEPDHGNARYCCEEHENAARKFRQGERYGGISALLPILFHNHNLFESLFFRKQEVYTAAELENEGADFSLFRRLYPDLNNKELIRLDFGTYYLETADNFQTFKLNKHETTTRNGRRSKSINSENK